MGIKSYLSAMLSELAAYNYGKPNSADELKASVMRMDPKNGKGGFLGVNYIVHCSCGDNIQHAAYPEPKSRNETDAECSPELQEVVEINGAPSDPDERTAVATNIGASTTYCESCGMRFVVGWEFRAVELNAEVTFPTDGEDVPDRPASGASMTTLKRNGTLH